MKKSKVKMVTINYETYLSDKKKRNMVFLDLDGVLCVGEHRRRDKDCFKYFNKRCVRNLKYIIKNVPDIEIIISSVWRSTMEHVGMAWERAKLPRNVLVGKTGYDPHRIRGNEINAWLKDGLYKNWVVIDDDSFDIEKLVPAEKFFHTTFNYGLTKPIARAIVKYFNT